MKPAWSTLLMTSQIAFNCTAQAAGIGMDRFRRIPKPKAAAPAGQPL